MFNISALNGDCWSTPASTIEACWSALGAGANGLTLTVYLTSDNQLVCAPDEQLLNYTGQDVCISDASLADIQKLDAGATWRSTELKDGQPTGAVGEDTPWVAPNDWQRVYFPELALVLQTFGRRTNFQLKLADDANIANHLIPLLQQFGLINRINLITNQAQIVQISMQAKDCRCVLDITALTSDTILPQINESTSIRSFWILYEQLDTLTSAEREDLAQLLYVNNQSLQVTSNHMPYALTRIAYENLSAWKLPIDVLVAKGALPSVEQQTPACPVFSEDFNGPSVNPTQWALGYSHDNDDTQISINDGLVIDIKQGGHYSGGAAVMKIPTHGDFDAQVGFSVAHPHQGTTFEMAAISINPSYKKTNLTFDVHGAPPYASSERDEDDGFRCGWNNGLSVTNFILSSDDIKAAANSGSDYSLWGEPYSSNIYNCYGRDVGYGKIDSPDGYLRLVRHKEVFNTYYRDKFNKAWVCSGSMLVTNLPDDVFIRLAAKHWKKKNPEPPRNTVVFKEFVIKQY
ncbi:glycerophosphodiester phosphodiesterase family protein [Thalassotalea fusca]